MVIVQPGDILCTRSGGWTSRLIRLGAALLDRPNTVNHVVIVTHTDDAGTLWGIEGRPGGVGWVAARRFLSAPYTLTNAAQPKTDEQRAQTALAAQSMLGVGYDWLGIAADTALALRLKPLWSQDWHGLGPPAHVVCSSLADWVYEHVGLASPGGLTGTRYTTPADWAAFITERQWESHE